MNILQVNTHDRAGGAAAVARQLFQEMKTCGHHVRFAVGVRRLEGPDIHQIQSSPSGREKSRKIRRLLTRPGTVLRRLRGIEDFDFPDSWHILSLPGGRPDIVHAHNLHGGYFDLRYLPELSKKVPVILSLHDAWLLAGHCAHSFDCERWRDGCGMCPDLSIYPPVLADNTAFNWKRKQDIYSRSRVYISTPSQWLMNKVENSMLAPAVIEKRVIPCGVNLDVFKPGVREEVRRELNLPQDKRILLFTSNGIRNNEFRDYNLLRKTLSGIEKNYATEKILLLALGEEAPDVQIGNIEINFIPKQSDPGIVAKYYQAANIYVHASKVDTFPLVILEAMACGLPVVATAVGGIPEQIRSLRLSSSVDSDRVYDEREATGVLVEPGNADAMANAIQVLIDNQKICDDLGNNASVQVKNNSGLEREVENYLAWYKDILANKNRKLKL